MNGKHQATLTVEVNAPAAEIWSVIADQSLLTQWVPPVTELLEVTGDGVGMTRKCSVDFQGRSGTMTERCVEFVPHRRAGYVVVDDSLGFNKMLEDYGFTITLDDQPGGGTALRWDTYYTPRNFLAALMNRLVLKRKMRKTLAAIASGLKTFSEQRAAAWLAEGGQPGPASP